MLSVAFVDSTVVWHGIPQVRQIHTLTGMSRPCVALNSSRSTGSPGSTLARITCTGAGHVAPDASDRMRNATSERGQQQVLLRHTPLRNTHTERRLLNACTCIRARARNAGTQAHKHTHTRAHGNHMHVHGNHMCVHPHVRSHPPVCRPHVHSQKVSRVWKGQAPTEVARD